VAFLLFVCSHHARRRRDSARAAPRATFVRRCAAALGRESYGIYLWHFICVYATFHFFDHAFGEKNGETSLALFGATLIAVLVVSYALSRVSDRLIQGRATRLSRRLLASVDRRFRLTREA
jgi:peptidoglycan/LPS O-acetylase OafA/YrhL